jgi:hypothetical protein
MANDGLSARAAELRALIEDANYRYHVLAGHPGCRVRPADA